MREFVGIRAHGERGHVVNTASMAGIAMARALRPVAAARSCFRRGAGADRAIREEELYIFTHPDMRAEVEPRFSAILAAMDRVEAP